MVHNNHCIFKYNNIFFFENFCDKEEQRLQKEYITIIIRQAVSYKISFQFDIKFQSSLNPGNLIK